MPAAPSTFLVQHLPHHFVDYHSEFVRLGEIGFFNCFEGSRSIYTSLCRSALRGSEVPPVTHVHVLILGRVGSRAYVSCSVTFGAARHATVLLPSDMLILWMEDRDDTERVVRNEILRSLRPLSSGRSAVR